MLNEDRYAEIEARLRPLVRRLDWPHAGEWLKEHPERGQTFQQYVRANPVRRGGRRNTIYVSSLGDFTEAHEKVLDLTREYLGLFFAVPVGYRRHFLLSEVPLHARRRHPQWGDQQVLTSFVLKNLLEPDRPEDALAYLAVTTCDHWPGGGWNFLFGEADFRKRVGVSSLYRNGPITGDGRKFLWRTLAIASHETAHMLTMRHCTAFA
jgi:archaemetzincin